MDVYVIGMGPGNRDFCTKRAESIIAACPVLVGDKRLLAPFAATGKRLVETYKRADIEALVRELGEDGSPLAVLVSGDVGFFSLAALVKDLPGCTVHRIPGISSLVYFAAALSTSWNDAFVVSRHGRRQPLVPAVRQHQKVFCLTGGDERVEAICAELAAQGFGKLQAAAGENLSYPEERIVQGRVEELAAQHFASLAVLMIFNPAASPVMTAVHGLDDTEFLRGKAPMTKQEVRALAISKLRPGVSDTIYDVGAGTGSCSVELSLQAPYGQVYALEMKDEALGLLEKNKERFGLTNLTIVPGAAEESLADLPAPDCAFIGGTKGQLASILDTIYEKNPACRIVITAITLETVSAVLAYYSQRPFYQSDIVQLSAARGRVVGTYHLMTAENPVYIITAVKKGVETHA